MGKTIQVAADRAFDETKTIMPVEVARGVYVINAPSLAALKLMHLMIAQAGGRMAEPVRHEIRLSDIRKIKGMDNHSRASLTPLFEELRAMTLREGDPNDDNARVVIGGLLDQAVLDRKDPISGDTLLSWYFGRSFLEMAEQSNHWAIIDRQTAFRLKSRYSMLLFQHISSLVHLEYTNSRTFTVSELRAVLGIEPGKLDRFSNLKGWALTPAITEINEESRLILTATVNKIGRTVASVTISWEAKPMEAQKELKAEMDRHSAGRKARRSGTVDTVTESFPDSGSISYSRWNDVAKAELPQPRRDPDLVADDFRRWCAGKNISLTAPTIENTFRSFCRKVDRAS